MHNSRVGTRTNATKQPNNQHINIIVTGKKAHIKKRNCFILITKSSMRTINSWSVTLQVMNNGS